MCWSACLKFLAFSVLLSTLSLADPASAIDASWLNPADGAWTTASNWSTPYFPRNGSPSSGSRYDVTIDAAGSPYTVTLGQTLTVDSVTVDSPDATLSLVGNYELSSVNGIHVEQGTLLLDSRAALANTRLSTGSEGRAVSGATNYVTLRNVELAGKFSAQNYLTVEGTLNFDNGLLQFAAGSLGSSAELRGTGEWQLTSGRAESSDFPYRVYFYASSDQRMRIGHGVTVRSMGESVVFERGTYLTQAAADTVVNQGQILAETAGGYLYIRKFLNEGLVRVANGDRFSATYAGTVGHVDLLSGGTLTVSGAPHFNLPLSVGAGTALTINAETQATTSQPLSLGEGGIIYLQSPQSIVPISSTGGQVHLIFHSTGPSLTATQLRTLPVSGSAEVVLQSTYVGFDMEGGVFDYTSLPENYVFKPGFLTNGTLTGPQTPQNLSHRLRGATLDVPLDLSSGLVRLELTSTLAKPVQVSGGRLELSENWSNGAGIRVSAGEVQLLSAGASPGELDFSGGTLRITHATTLAAIESLDFGTPAVLAIGETPNGNRSGTLDLQGETLNLNEWESTQWAITRVGIVRNGTIIGSHDGPTLQFSGGNAQNVVLYGVKTNGGNIYSSTAENLWSTGYLNASGSTLIDSRVDGNLNGGIIQGQLEANGFVSGTVQFLAGSSLTGTGGLGGGTGRGVRDRFTFVDSQVTLPAEIELVSSTQYDSNTILDAPATALTVEGDILIGFHTSNNPSWTDSWTFQVASLETHGNTTVTADGKLYVSEAAWTNHGKIQLTGGLLDYETLRIEEGGELAGWGSMIGDVVVVGDLTVTKPLNLTGDLILNASATTKIELGSSTLLPTIVIDGSASLAGELQVDLKPAFFGQTLAVGNRYTLITADSLDGLTAPFETNHPLINFSLIQTADELLIEIMDLPSVAGDLNFDDVVNELDIAIWRDAYGLSLAGDADLDGDTDGRDFLLLQRQYGASAQELGDFHNVPEPATSMILACCALLVQVFCRRRQRYSF